jgi:hypothetical protein
MNVLALLIGLAAAALLLSAGYLLGIRSGHRARAEIAVQNAALSDEVTRLRERDKQHRKDDETLRAAIQRVVMPLVHKEQVSMDMARLEGGTDQQRDLAALLTQMADKGNFSAVLLSDDQGWPLAASGAATEQERLGATSSLLLLLADRLSRDGSPTPTSLMVGDAHNRMTLCRLFTVEDQRLLLSVVGVASQMAPLALDPALARLGAVLSKKARGAALGG